MYIYCLNQQNMNNSIKFDVKKQVCAQCLLAHAENKLDNSILEPEMQSFVSKNRRIICDHVTATGFAFVTSKSNNIIFFNSICNLPQQFVNNFKTHLNNPEIYVYSAEHINKNFHNHSQTNNISLNLYDNHAAVTVIS